MYKKYKLNLFMDGLFNDGFRSAYVSTIVVKRVYVKYSQETHNLSIQFFLPNTSFAVALPLLEQKTYMEMSIFFHFFVYLVLILKQIAGYI